MVVAAMGMVQAATPVKTPKELAIEGQKQRLDLEWP